MESQIIVNQQFFPDQVSRILYIITPFRLVRLGPDLDTAIKNLIITLTTLFVQKGKLVHHFATTYSLATITIIIEFKERGESPLQLFQLRLRDRELTASEFEDARLSTRVIDQLQNIQKNQPRLAIPFRCVEDWQGLGSKEHDIYNRMVKASTSKDDWQKFMEDLRRRRKEIQLKNGSSSV
jgi:hypothetical protein